MEAWKAIPGFDNYEASDLGQIKSKRGILRPQKAGAGYLKVKVNGQQLYVHRLIALTFIGEIIKGFEVNHLDFDKHNNKPENLEICTPCENRRHFAAPVWYASQTRLPIFKN